VEFSDGEGSVGDGADNVNWDQARKRFCARASGDNAFIERELFFVLQLSRYGYGG